MPLDPTKGYTGKADIRNIKEGDIKELHEMLKESDAEVLPDRQMKGVWKLYCDNCTLDVIIKEGRIFEISRTKREKHEVICDYHLKYHMDHCIQMYDLVKRIDEAMEAIPETYSRKRKQRLEE